MLYLKYDAVNLGMKERLTDIENRFVVAKGKDMGKDWGFGFSRHKLLYIG